MLKKLTLIGALLALGACQPEDTEARIKAGCEREFKSRGETAVNDCQIRLMLRHLAEQEAAKLNRAR